MDAAAIASMNQPPFHHHHHHHYMTNHHRSHHTSFPSIPAEQSIAAKSRRTQILVAHFVSTVARLPLALAMGKRYAPHDLVWQLELALLVMIGISTGLLCAYIVLQGIAGCSSRGIHLLDQLLTARSEAIYIIVQAMFSTTSIGLALGAFLAGPFACPRWIADDSSSDPIGLWCWRQIIIAVLSLASLTMVVPWYNVLREMVDRSARQTGTGRRAAWKTPLRVVVDRPETARGGWDAEDPRERLDLADDVWLEEERVDPFSEPISVVSNGVGQIRQPISTPPVGMSQLRQVQVGRRQSGVTDSPPAYVSVASETGVDGRVREVSHTPLVAVSLPSSRRVRNK